MSSRRRAAIPDLANLARGIRARERAVIARAITLVESRRADHQKAARRLVQELLPLTGKAIRVGMTGAPGVGKSTTIDVLGTFLTAKGHKVAVLAVDPSSTRSGGSILADKTRMPRLGNDPNAFVRPSPASGTLGGVAAKTRESMLICEAAGYDVVLVETIGTGQSETMVADGRDLFGADRRRRCRAVGKRSRPPQPHERSRRVRRAAARAAGEVDVGDARRSRLRAPQIRSRAQSKASSHRGRGRGGADVTGGRSRRDCSRVGRLTLPAGNAASFSPIRDTMYGPSRGAARRKAFRR